MKYEATLPPGARLRSLDAVPRALQMMADMERDPDGHYWANLPGDRRLPPWYVGAPFGAMPDWARAKLTAFLEGIAGLRPSLFDLFYNWVTDEFDFVRWIPSWEPQSPWLGLMTWAPLALDSWSGDLGWEGLTDRRLAKWRMAFIQSPADLRSAQAKLAEYDEQMRTRMQLAPLVADGSATAEQREQYAAALAVTDGGSEAEYRDLADRLRKPMQDLATNSGL
jgi:hypothetical protein